MRTPTGIRLYRRLLAGLPEDMRRRFGPDMEELLAHRLHQARGSAIRTCWVWIRAVVDVAVQTLTLRLDERESTMRPDSVLQDIRYALRGLRGSPGLAILAIVTLALGIGASTSTFSIVHGVLLEKLPFGEPDRLVMVWPEANANKAMTLLAEERMPSLEAVAGLSGWSLTLTGAGDPREIAGLKVSTNYFDLLRVRPELGRGFVAGEDLPGAAGVVVLSHDLWVSAFGSDPSIVGRVIELGGADYDRRRVIGVMPPGVNDVFKQVQAWIPLEGDPALSLGDDSSWYVNERVARLAPGATIEQANAEVRPYAEEVRRTLPNLFSEEEAAEATVREIRDYLTSDVRTSIWIALGTVSIVLLIGCFNVTNLLLARGERREQDLAVRVALGAGRARVTRMHFTEAAILGIAGGALGIATAFGLVRLLVAQAPDTVPGISDVSVSPVVLLFAVGVTVVSTLIAGVVPAVRAGRVRATAALGGATRGAARRGASRLTPTLVGGQIALAVVATIGSGLMLRSLTTLLAVDPGLDGHDVLVFNPTPPSGRYPDGPAFRDYYSRVAERVAALPFVESVGGIHLLPGNPNNWSFPTFPEGFEIEEDGQTPSVNFRVVRDDYFATARIPLRAGRLITNADRADTEPVAMVNEAFVAQYWPGENPLGKTLRIFSREGTPYRVVGVVGDVRQLRRDLEPLPEMYLSHEQAQWNQMSMWILARVRPTAGGPTSYAPAIREAVWSIDPEVPIPGMANFEDELVESTGDTRFLTLLLSAFGALALLLSAVGVFGVTAYASGRRRAEFGVRIALGSSYTSILRSAIGRSLTPVAAGLAAGMIGAWFASRWLASELYGVTTSDPTTYAGVAVVMLLTAVLAALAPAWRATRVDPAKVLTSD